MTSALTEVQVARIGETSHFIPPKFAGSPALCAKPRWLRKDHVRKPNDLSTAPTEFETAPQTPSNARAGATGQNGHNGKQRPLVSKTFQAHERGAAGGKSFNHKRIYHIAHGLTPSLEIC